MKELERSQFGRQEEIVSRLIMSLGMAIGTSPHPLCDVYNNHSPDPEP